MTDRKLRHRVWAGSHLRRDAGQALIETAISIPLLMLLLLGAAELGRVAYASIEVSNAARAAVQYGAMNGGAYTDTQGMLNAAAADANEVYKLNPSSFKLTSSYSCICADGTASTCAIGDCQGSHLLATVTVRTQATFTPLINLPGLPLSYTLYGKAVQKVLQ